MQAYLDNSATTRCSEGVRDIVVKVMMEDFGNFHLPVFSCCSV